MPKYRRLKAFRRRMMFKYKLTITNEDKLEEVVDVRISKLNGISVFITGLAGLFVIVGALLAYTPLRESLPGYMDANERNQAINNVLRTDSLLQVVERRSLYIMNIQDIFHGRVRPDTIRSIDSLTTIREDSLKERTRREEEFRRKYEEAEKYNLTTVASQADAAGLVFFSPAKGILSTPFNTQLGHHGVDIASNLNESVLATLEGTVILSAYTAETGYVIGIQHAKDFVSIYKRCGSLLKKEGSKVKAGEAIALVGGPLSGPLAKGPHLHFELWNKGKAVNPENYVAFQ